MSGPEKIVGEFGRKFLRRKGVDALGDAVFRDGAFAREVWLGGFGELEAALF